MVIELNANELELIERWYHAAAGESMSGSDAGEDHSLLQNLLAKLNFEMHHQDAYEIQRHSVNACNVSGPA